MAHQPGQLVTDNLGFVRLLGKGGMGSVWVADHLTLPYSARTSSTPKFLMISTSA